MKNEYRVRLEYCASVIVADALRDHGGSVKAARAELGLKYSYFYKLCKKFNIRPADYRRRP
jgi:hypothetical protein